ncbi:hypothetical protein, partial [Aeromonas caviae]|uniref:hypothetical protein n=1 Tax=Aeromonas caviae TaxID=648 RepID=UPI0029DE6735
QQGASSLALAIEQQRARFPLWCPIRVAQLHLVRSLGACPGSAAAGAGQGHRIGRDRPGTKGEGISDTPRRQRPAVLQYLVRHRDQQLQRLASRLVFGIKKPPRKAAFR